MTTELLEQAISSTRGVLATVSKQQLGEDTPCAEWKISDLINHVVGGQYWFAAMVHGEEPDPAEVDFSATDFVSAFDEGAERSLAAFRADGAMDRLLSLPFGEMPCAAFLRLAVTDTFTHGWDLARATGQSTDLSPDLAATILEGVRESLRPEFRNEQGNPFGPEQAAPAGAGSADQLAAFLGRRV
ncbi:MAG TPA: TIGR03086 family metal-binding protein [Acidimicrobiales bacterium]|nr:TIGR03086 family metal-binding protein [Acidimicrobiales bacterium]